MTHLSSSQPLGICFTTRLSSRYLSFTGRLMNGELRGFGEAEMGNVTRRGGKKNFTETCGHCDISLNQASLEGNVAGFTRFDVAEACFTVLCNSEGLLCLASSRLVHQSLRVVILKKVLED